MAETLCDQLATSPESTEREEFSEYPVPEAIPGPVSGHRRGVMQNLNKCLGLSYTIGKKILPHNLQGHDSQYDFCFAPGDAPSIHFQGIDPLAYAGIRIQLEERPFTSLEDLRQRLQEFARTFEK